MIVLGVPNGATTARFVDHVLRRFGRLGATVRAVLTDNGPEYVARSFTAALAAKGLAHPPHPASLAQPQRRVRALPGHRPAGVLATGVPPASLWERAPAPGEVDAWLIHYNTRRRNHSDFMRGRTPKQIMTIHRIAPAA